MQYIAFDTNIFFSMQVGIAMGQTTNEVLQAFTMVAKKGKEKSLLTFITTPTIVKELHTFFEEEEKEAIYNLLALVKVVSPTPTQIDTGIFLEYIEENRKRNIKGMQVAEEIMGKIAQDQFIPLNKTTQEKQKSVGVYINSFRERYRNTTRTGFIDSVADIELILLAKEYRAKLLSADEGLLVWSRKIGIEELQTNIVKRFFDDLLA
jgi:RNA ligase partner protein